MSVPSSSPLVSIIVITYNSSKYVLETLQSAKAQTYQNIELIISDDSSQDQTVEICKNWLIENEGRFVNTQIITVKKNTGIPANCNRGVKASKGEWIKLIAGDDILYTSCIEKNIIHVSENTQIEVLFSDLMKFTIKDSSQLFIETKNNISFLDFFDDRTTPSEQNGKLLLADNVNTPSSFISAKIFDRIGLFDEDFPLIEDYPFWIRLTKNNIKLFYMSLPTVYYRLHIDSVYNGVLMRNDLISKLYLRNEKMREKYIYPDYTTFGKYYFKSIFFIKNNLKSLSNNTFNRFLVKILSRYLNPFVYIFNFLLFFQKPEDILVKTRLKK